MTLPRVNTGTYDKMAVREQYRTHFSLIQKSHPAIVAVSGLDHPPGGFLFPEWVAFFTGIRRLGRLMLDALTDRDYPVVAGINLTFAAAVMGINRVRLFCDDLAVG